MSACTLAGEETKLRVLLDVKEGMTEQQLLSILGPPTETRQPSPDCGVNNHPGTARELLYHARWVILGGLLNGPVSQSSYVCLDTSGTVVEVGMIDY